MLQINPISNFNNQINFNGKFKKSYALSKAIEKADKYDLEKFDEFLKRMSKTDDRRLFEMHSIIENNYGRQFHMVNLKEYKMRYNSNTVENMKINRLSDKDYEDIAYRGVLAKLNNILEGIYPDNKAGNIDKKTLIENIYKQLS